MKRILKVQEQIGVLSKKSENPFFKSAYLDLNDLIQAVQPLLHAEGLTLLQPIREGMVKSIIFDVKENKSLAYSELALPPITDPQKLGSCITYFRRYTLKSLLAIAEQDDDANLASKPEPKKPNLVVNSKEFHSALTKGSTIEALKKHLTISEQTEKEYNKQLNK